MLRSGLSRYGSTALSSDLAHRYNITTARIYTSCLARALSTSANPPSGKPKSSNWKPRKPNKGGSRPRKDDSDEPNPRKRERTFTEDGKPKLRAYDLTQRLVKLCEEGELNEAIEQLKEMPHDAQDVACWNTIMKHALKDGRYKQAYQLFIEVSLVQFGMVPMGCALPRSYQSVSFYRSSPYTQRFIALFLMPQLRQS